MTCNIFRILNILALAYGIIIHHECGHAFAARPAASHELPTWISDLPWIEERGNHFLVYSFDSDRGWSAQVLAHAERYYQSISNDIGYGSVEQSWTWEDRVKIYLFPDKESFQKHTGWPAWSRGGVLRRHFPSMGKMVVSFKQEDLFLTEVLPHEIAHLLLREFMGEEIVIPLWFEEGMAQLQEENKRNNARRLMMVLAADGIYIPFTDFFVHDIRREPKAERAMVFYSQSVSLLDFLLTQYGRQSFQNFCRVFRDGRDLERALFNVYGSQFFSREEFEKKWLRYIKGD